MAVYVMIVVSPGPNFVLVTRYALRGYLRGAFGLLLGFAAGATINACLTMFGAGALIVRVPLFGFVVSLVGGGFLAYLGLSAIYNAVRERQIANSYRGGQDPHVRPHKTVPSPVANNLRVGMQKGIVVNLLNPKGIVFFIGLYAPLIAQENLTTKMSVLAAGFITEVVWYCLVIGLVSRTTFRNAYERASGTVDTVLGVALTLVGLRIMMEAGNYMGST